MEVCDIDLNEKLWTISKEKSKTKKKFVRPLAPETLKIIKWQIDTFGSFTNYVFPSGNYKRHISLQTINKLSRAVVRSESMERWSCHDFRRTLSTVLSANKVELHVTKKMLGHSLGGILAFDNIGLYKLFTTKSRRKHSNLLQGVFYLFTFILNLSTLTTILISPVFYINQSPHWPCVFGRNGCWKA